jgi:hypothetical protein
MNGGCSLPHSSTVDYGKVQVELAEGRPTNLRAPAVKSTVRIGSAGANIRGDFPSTGRQQPMTAAGGSGTDSSLPNRTPLTVVVSTSSPSLSPSPSGSRPVTSSIFGKLLHLSSRHRRREHIDENSSLAGSSPSLSGPPIRAGAAGSPRLRLPPIPVSSVSSDVEVRHNASLTGGSILCDRQRTVDSCTMSKMSPSVISRSLSTGSRRAGATSTSLAVSGEDTGSGRGQQPSETLRGSESNSRYQLPVSTSPVRATMSTTSSCASAVSADRRNVAVTSSTSSSPSQVTTPLLRRSASAASDSKIGRDFNSRSMASALSRNRKQTIDEIIEDITAVAFSPLVTPAAFPSSDERVNPDSSAIVPITLTAATGSEQTALDSANRDSGVDADISVHDVIACDPLLMTSFDSGDVPRDLTTAVAVSTVASTSVDWNELLTSSSTAADDTENGSEYDEVTTIAEQAADPATVSVSSLPLVDDIRQHCHSPALLSGAAAGELQRNEQNLNGIASCNMRYPQEVDRSIGGNGHTNAVCSSPTNTIRRSDSNKRCDQDRKLPVRFVCTRNNLM